MEKIQVEVYSQATNIPVIKMPGRKFPGSVIQGDSLMVLFGLAKEVYEKVKNLDDEDLVYGALELKESLKERIEHYESVIEKSGMKLPYNRILK